MIERLLEAERALSFGLVDRAEEIYQQVAETDPRNSIAIVGLARVALERGDDHAAYRLARQGLAIDPDNDTARRMAARLEEVLATRGEPVPSGLPSASPPTSTVEPPAPAVEPPTPAVETPIPRSLLDRLRRR